MKRSRQESCLKNCQLCNHFLTRSGCRAGSHCNYAHSLDELEKRPRDWPYAKGHRWSVGDPLPPPNALKLLQTYAKAAGPGLKPQWFDDLCLALCEEENEQHVQQAQQQSSSSGRREEPNQDQPMEGPGPKQDEPSKDEPSAVLQPRPPDFLPPAVLLHRALDRPNIWDDAKEKIISSILGWGVNLSEHLAGISIGILMARGREVEVCLSGYEELNVIPINDCWGDITLIRS